MELCYKIVRKLVLIAIWPFMGKVIGLNNIPKNKPVILAANHASYLDHYIIGAYVSDKLDRHVHFLSKKEHFDNIFKRAWDAEPECGSPPSISVPDQGAERSRLLRARAAEDRVTNIADPGSHSFEHAQRRRDRLGQHAHSKPHRARGSLF